MLDLTTRIGGIFRSRIPRQMLGAAVAGLLVLWLVPWESGAAAAQPGDPGPVWPPGCAQPVSTWSLDQLVNELLMVGGQFSDLQASKPQASAGVGGFVLFGQPPAGSGPSIRTDMSVLLSAAVDSGRAVPWMSTDEEGGGVQRLSNVIGSMPSPRQMASQWTPAQVQAELTSEGQAMRFYDITMDLAPVLDVSSASNPVADEGQRSFSSDPNVVSSYGIAYQTGLQAAGVVPVVKHFPGLGHASANTDTGPSTDPSLGQLQSDDLIPFERAVAAGAPVVMVGNMMVPGLTDGQPASLSPAAYSYLRKNVHFAGVAMTDDLDAGAISSAGYSQPSAVVKALEAGADMAMIDASQWSATVSAVEQAVQSGSLPLPRVEASVGRILAAKSLATCPTVAVSAVPGGGGYWLAGSGGAVRNFGSAGAYGQVNGVHLNLPVVGTSPTADGHGYWLVASDGGVFSYGDAHFYGSTGGIKLNKPVVGMAATPDGHGYWLVASDGGIFSYGDAHFYGSGG